MFKRAALFVGVIGLSLVVTAQAADTIKKLSGGTLNGAIKSITKTEVTIEKTTGASETVPVIDIDTIFFEGEPLQLKLVRGSAASGSYAGALATLEKIDAGASARPEIKQEMAYWRGYCMGKQGIEHSNKDEMTAAARELVGFVSESPSNYHALAAYELLGDLSVAVGKPEAAAKFYGELAQSPFAEYKLRAGVAIGRSLAAQKKFAEALASFDSVLKMAATAKGSTVEQEKTAATLGRGVCLANDGKVDEAVKLVEDVINTLPAEEAALQAEAYVTLGECYLKKPDHQKQALLAFLHVDVLYSSQIDAEKKALEQLAVLWKEMKKPERAADASNRLAQLTGGGSQ